MSSKFCVLCYECSMFVEQCVQERASGVFLLCKAASLVHLGFDSDGLRRFENGRIEPLTTHGPRQQDHRPRSPPSNIHPRHGILMSRQIPPHMTMHPRLPIRKQNGERMMMHHKIHMVHIVLHQVGTERPSPGRKPPLLLPHGRELLHGLCRCVVVFGECKSRQSRNVGGIVHFLGEGWGYGDGWIDDLCLVCGGCGWVG
mmetsp:Transcript_7544/g.17099  ORF Transcript_7544/g.17099 Transcript_7544/m.17099 type:complete len:200 (-) Transcript_7544:488-1087(-)